jgi:hypothetical protein
MQDQGPIKVYGWDWGRDEDRRPQVPWVGVFLLILGGLLIFEQLAPQYRNLGDVVVLAAGLAFLVVWAVRRSSFALYAGALLTAAAVPGLVEGVTNGSFPGLGTVAYGLAFLLIAAVRGLNRGGWGWQLVLGLVLLAVGASEMTLPDLADLTLPLLLVILGVVLITRGRR